ncbi:MAG: hypothetical protein AAFQ51_09430, partial [Pseudomonadota bacterium]
MRSRIADWSAFHVADGTAQETRMPAALAEDWILPQERGLADWIAVLATLSDHVRFGGVDDPPGSWRRLFDSDPITVMAEVLTFRPEEALTRFLTTLERAPTEARGESAALSATLDRWVRVLHAGEVGEVDTQLALLDADGAAAAGSLAADRARVLSAVGRRAPRGESPVAAARAARDALITEFEDLLNAVAVLRPSVEVAFSERVSSGRLDPTLGLLIAELRTLERVTEGINTFSARHTRFYYGDILGQSPAAAREPDLLLHVAPGSQPVDVPAGARLALRAGGAPVAGPFEVARGTRIAPVEVLGARTLRYERDSTISPQCGLGFVTGIRASETGLTDGAAGRRLFDADPQSPVAMGLRIAHPVLAMAEGDRCVEITLHMSRREGVTTDPDRRRAEGSAAQAADLARLLSADPALIALFGHADADAAAEAISGQIDALPVSLPRLLLIDEVYHACLIHLTTADQLSEICGRIVTRGLIEGVPWPEGAYLAALNQRLGEGLIPSEVARHIRDRIFGWNRLDVFQTMLGDAFLTELTGAKGAVLAPACRIAPNDHGPGLTLTLDLDAAAPGVAPRAGQEAPELTVRLAPRAGFCPLSLFEPFRIDRVSLTAQVRGVTSLRGFTDDGPVDIGQPFAPFGARPRDGASFVIGSPELARKTISDVALSLTWGGLPTQAGGFATHYAAYGPDTPVPDPKLDLAYRAGDGWKPLNNAPLPMVETRRGADRLEAQRRFVATVPGRGVAARGTVEASDFRQRRTVRAGALRLTLSGSGDGFGREVYPAALADAVRPRLLQLRARPVPPQPFVPQIVEVSLDYTACADILLDAPDTADPGARVTQVTPFGSQELFPARTRRDVGLLPDRLADGILMLNLPAAAMEGPVSLLFDLAEGSHDRLAFVPEPVAWHRLTARGWRRLPNWAVTADSTDGLMRSGIVSLDLPGEAVEGATELPGSGIWIAATANRRLDDFPGLAALRTNGLRISVAPAEGTGYPGPRTWAFDPAVPGLGAVTEVVPVRGGTRAETTDAFNTRVAERLRHRQRAVTPWDVERLVLTAFPEVWKAKCFPALDRTDPAPAPGRITVVVVPFAPHDAHDAPERRVMFDVLTLRRIRSYLAGRLSPFAEVEVRNPGFERIQLHARFRFARDRDDGALVRRIKGDVSRMLSVWTSKPPMNGFG